MPLAPAAQATTASAPPPRRKSCGCCVKAKRRCDLQTPCSRCTEKGLACEYPPSVGAWRPDRSQSRSKAVAAVSDEFDSAALCPISVDGFDFSGVEDGMPGLEDGCDLDLPVNLGETPSFLSGGGAFYPMDDALGNSEPQPTPGRDVYTREDYADFYELRQELDQGKLGNPNSASAYIIAMVRNFPNDLALKMKTTFLHPRLYEDDMPKIVLDAFTTSMLYSNKNTANAAAVFKALDANASDLLQQQGESGRRPTRDLLVMVQALLIYQIIRVFDGDIRQRGHAESAMPALREMTAHLEQHRDQLTSIPGTGSEPPHWDSWLFEECTRRTVLVSYFFISKYHLLRDGYRKPSDPGSFRRAHHWTLSRHLWDAPSSFEFTRAWKEKPRWNVSNCFVKQVLLNGKATDVDDLGRMYIVSYLGTDATKRWYYETGSSFD